jgi:hypothetical protein
MRSTDWGGLGAREQAPTRRVGLLYSFRAHKKLSQVPNRSRYICKFSRAMDNTHVKNIFKNRKTYTHFSSIVPLPLSIAFEIASSHIKTSRLSRPEFGRRPDTVSCRYASSSYDPWNARDPALEMKSDGEIAVGVAILFS